MRKKLGYALYSIFSLIIMLSPANSMILPQQMDITLGVADGDSRTYVVDKVHPNWPIRVSPEGLAKIELTPGDQFTVSVVNATPSEYRSSSRIPDPSDPNNVRLLSGLELELELTIQDKSYAIDNQIGLGQYVSNLDWEENEIDLKVVFVSGDFYSNYTTYSSSNYLFTIESSDRGETVEYIINIEFYFNETTITIIGDIIYEKESGFLAYQRLSHTFQDVDQTITGEETIREINFSNPRSTNEDSSGINMIYVFSLLLLVVPIVSQKRKLGHALL